MSDLLEMLSEVKNAEGLEPQDHHLIDEIKKEIQQLKQQLADSEESLEICRDEISGLSERIIKLNNQSERTNDL